MALTIKLDRLPVALRFLLLEQFKASTGARQEQPEALAQREGEELSARVPPSAGDPKFRRGLSSEARPRTGHSSHLNVTHRLQRTTNRSSKLVQASRPLSMAFSLPGGPSLLYPPGNSGPLPGCLLPEGCALSARRSTKGLTYWPRAHCLGLNPTLPVNCPSEPVFSSTKWGQ